MSHFAEIDENNIVIRVLVGDNSFPDEGKGWLEQNLGGRWEKTSYTSYKGKRVDPDNRQPVSDNHYRYNFAGVGYYFDENYGENGAFIPPQTYKGWILNENCYWEPPTPSPGDNWYWDENIEDWVEFSV